MSIHKQNMSSYKKKILVCYTVKNPSHYNHQNTLCGKHIKQIESFTHDKLAVSCNKCLYELIPLRNTSFQ